MQKKCAYLFLMLIYLDFCSKITFAQKINPNPNNPKKEPKTLPKNQPQNKQLSLTDVPKKQNKNIYKKEGTTKDITIKNATTKPTQAKPKITQAKTNVKNIDTTKNKIFAQKLVFPLPKGKIVYGYGEKSPQNLNHIKIKNLGIDIVQISPQQDKVVAVAGGKISRIVKLKDRIGEIIVIKHQDFFSVYAHTLPLFSLKKGQMVKKGQTIGSVIADKNQQKILHFELWYNKKSLNPVLFFK